MKKKLINFILSFTDYDRLKKENKELKSDIHILVERQGELDYFKVVGKWKMQYVLDKTYWYGDSGLKNSEFNGLWKTIFEQHENNNKQ